MVYLKNKPSAFVNEEKPVISFEMTEELKKSITEALGSEAAEQVEKLYEQLDCGEKISPWEFVIEKELSKSERMAVHEFVREKLYQI